MAAAETDLPQPLLGVPAELVASAVAAVRTILLQSPFGVLAESVASGVAVLSVVGAAQIRAPLVDRVGLVAAVETVELFVERAEHVVPVETFASFVEGAGRVASLEKVESLLERVDFLAAVETVLLQPPSGALADSVALVAVTVERGALLAGHAVALVLVVGLCALLPLVGVLAETAAPVAGSH